MTAKAADIPAHPARSAYRGVVSLYCKVTFGATSVSTVAASKGVDFSRDGAGAYTLTFPACPDAFIFATHDTRGTPADLVPQLDTVNATSGTADLNLLAAATPTDPATGDILFIRIDCVTGSVT